MGEAPSDAQKAADAKAKGNAAFTAKNFQEAIEHFTEAIKYEASNHVFFSNRSACYASLEQYEKALEDGAKCVELKPDWPKGYARKGLAQFFLEKYDEAAETYKQGLKLAPEDQALKEGLQKAMDAKYEVPGSGVRGGGVFGKAPGASLSAMMAQHPKLKGYLQDKALMQKINALMVAESTGNESLVQQMFMEFMKQDPRLLEIIAVAQGIDPTDLPSEADIEMRPASASKTPAPTEEKEVKQKEAPQEPPAEDLRSPSEKEAEELKAKGNTFYKKRKFHEAMELYDQAIAKEPNDLTYYNNKCAVWIEMGEEHYPKVLKTCQELIDRRYDMQKEKSGGASFEKVGKVYCRMASVYEKQHQYDKAIEMYQKALTEDNNRQTRNALREVERAKEKWEREQYLDPVKAEEHREKGNEHFKKNDFVAAKQEYDEAIKRNPKDAKLYSNRAAALTKLLAYPDALRDLDECLKLDPKFIKAYSRKGAAHFFMKEYHKALEAYQNGLAIEPENEECLRGQDQVMAKVMEASSSEKVDEEQIQHAMADPEIQRILKDPHVKLFLRDLQENPTEAKKAMRADSKLLNAFSKLMASGILRVGGRPK